MDSLKTEEHSQNNFRPRLTTTGKILLAVSGGAFVGMFAVSTPFILPAVRKICLPFVPATTLQINNVMKMLNGRTGGVLDLGSGDGRIVCNLIILIQHCHWQSVQSK